MSFLGHLGDRRRTCILLRAAGYSYNEIASFLDVNDRVIRHELEGVLEDFDGILDSRNECGKNGRLMRLVYLMGYSDASGESGREELEESIDGLLVRAEWLRSRMLNTASLMGGLNGDE